MGIKRFTIKPSFGDLNILLYQHNFHLQFISMHKSPCIPRRTQCTTPTHKCTQAPTDTAEPVPMEQSNDPFAAPSTFPYITSTPFAAQISNPFGDTATESGPSRNKVIAAFDDDSFGGGLSTADSPSSPPNWKDSKDFEGIDFAALQPAPAALANEAVTKTSPDYSHIDYNAFDIGHAKPDFASSTIMPVGNPTMLKKQTVNAAACTFDSDFFQSAAASAFQQFGSSCPNKTAFAINPQKRSLVALGGDVMVAAKTSNQMVMGNSYGGSFEKVIFGFGCLFERFCLYLACIAFDWCIWIINLYVLDGVGSNIFKPRSLG